MVKHTAADAYKPSYRPMPIALGLLVSSFQLNTMADIKEDLRAGAPALTPTALSRDVLASIV